MEVDKWLQSVGLGKYAAQFAAANVTSLHQVHALDETAIRELGVTVPGHVRRIVLAQAELGNTLQALSLDVRAERRRDARTRGHARRAKTPSPCALHLRPPARLRRSSRSAPTTTTSPTRRRT
jgi:hypothetical protein